MIPPAAPTPFGRRRTVDHFDALNDTHVGKRAVARAFAQRRALRHTVEQAQRDATAQVFAGVAHGLRGFEVAGHAAREHSRCIHGHRGGLGQLRFTDDGDGARNLVDRLRNARAGHDDFGDLIFGGRVCPGCVRWSRTRRVAPSSSWSQAGCDAPWMFSLTPPNSKTCQELLWKCALRLGVCANGGRNQSKRPIFRRYFLLLLLPLRRRHSPVGSRTEARDQTIPIRRGSDACGKGMRTSFRPSGQGRAQSGTSDTPSPRSTMTAIAFSAFSSKRSRGVMPTMRKYSSALRPPH